MRIPAAIRSIPRDASFFLGASFINATGKAVMWPLTTLYVHNVLGKSFGEAGLVLLYQAFAGVLGELAGGNLYYRIGPKAVVSGSFLLSSCFLFVIALTDSWPLYILMVCLYGFAMGNSNPAINAYIGSRWKSYRRQLYNMIYVGNNVGLSVGAMAGGLIAAYSFPLTYIVTGLTTLFFAVFCFLFMTNETKESEEETEDGEPERKWNRPRVGPVELHRLELFKNFRLYLFISIGSLFFWISFAQWSVGVAPYMEQIGLDLKYYSFLWIVNGMIILVGQPLTGWIKRRLAYDLVRQMLASALLNVIAFSFILLFHDHYIYFVIGMIPATLGEMLLLPAVPMLYAERAGFHAAFYMGVTGGMDNVGRMVGPVLFGHVFDYWGIGIVFLIGTAASVVSLIMFFLYARVNRKFTVDY